MCGTSAPATVACNHRTVSFEEVLLTGLADDGGLYVPDHLPPLAPDKLDELGRSPYAKVASHILGLFAGDAFAKMSYTGSRSRPIAASAMPR